MPVILDDAGERRLVLLLNRVRFRPAMSEPTREGVVVLDGDRMRIVDAGRIGHVS